MNETPIELRQNNDVLSSEDRLVAAYPKTGRTWLRFMLAHYIVQLKGIPVDLTFQNIYSVTPNTKSGQVPGQPSFAYTDILPKIVFTHEMINSDKTYPNTSVYLTRDPRDVLVSNWFHRTRQLRQFDGDLHDFVHDDRWGISSFIRHFNGWNAYITDKKRIVTYESMQRDTVPVLLNICDLLDIKKDFDVASAAVELASFGRMQKAETEHRVAGHSYNLDDPNARRVRAGKIGGFHCYLSDDDIRYIDLRVQNEAGEMMTLLEKDRGAI